MRTLAEPFVVAAPAGVRISTRLFTSGVDDEVLTALGKHLGHLAGSDLARRCAIGEDPQDAKHRTKRKRDLTSQCSARWAGTITARSDEAFALARRNLYAEARTLRTRINRINKRAALPTWEYEKKVEKTNKTASGKKKRLRGYATKNERYQKLRRRNILQGRLAKVQTQIESKTASVCKGGVALARNRHYLQEAGLTEQQWREEWESRRLFISANGSADEAWGNVTIRVHPADGWCEIKLPDALAHLSNRPHGRYRLSCDVRFPYKADEWAERVSSGSVRYDIDFDPSKSRWHLSASWAVTPPEPAKLEDLRSGKLLGVDLNRDHLAAWVLDCSGNPLGAPTTIPMVLTGPTATRDGHLRQAISEIIRLAKAEGCAAMVVEDLDFADARKRGKEDRNRGRWGKRNRNTTLTIPTAKARERLSAMAANGEMAVIAVDPAWSSVWGAQYWQKPLSTKVNKVSRHDSAAVVLGRRGLGLSARRRIRRDRNAPVDASRPDRAVAESYQFHPGNTPDSRQTGNSPTSKGVRAVRRDLGPEAATDYTVGDQADQDRSG